MNEKPSKTPSVVFPEEQRAGLPHFVEPCRQLSNSDFFEKINIFTEFGDLSPTQMLTLFDQFVNLPNYKECSFVASLENTLLKLHSNPSEKFDTLDLTLHDEDESEAVKR